MYRQLGPPTTMAPFWGARTFIIYFHHLQPLRSRWIRIALPLDFLEGRSSKPRHYCSQHILRAPVEKFQVRGSATAKAEPPHRLPLVSRLSNRLRLFQPNFQKPFTPFTFDAMSCAPVYPQRERRQNPSTRRGTRVIRISNCSCWGTDLDLSYAVGTFGHITNPMHPESFRFRLSGCFQF